MAIKSSIEVTHQLVAVVIAIVILAIVIAVIVTTMVTQPSPKTTYAVRAGGTPSMVRLLGNLSIYVVGSPYLINDVDVWGLNSTIIIQVGLNELGSIPNGSVVIINWDYIKSTVIKEGLNENDHNVTSLAL